MSPERGEVGGEVPGAAGDGVDARYGDGGDRSFAGDAGGSAVKILIEQEVADHDDREPSRGVEHGHQTVERVLTMRVDCY
jgi:hypothetical protein